MPVLWTLGILAALVALLLSVRIGVLAIFQGREILVYARIGVLKIQVWPRPVKIETPEQSERRKKREAKQAEKKKRKEKKKKNQKRKKAQSEEQAEKKSGTPPLRVILNAVKSLPGPLLKAFAHTARGIQINPCDLRVTFGGRDDPAGAAESRGNALAAVWAVMPILERRMKIPYPDITISADFDAPETRIDGEIGAAFRIGRLLYALIPVIMILLKLLFQLFSESANQKG